MENNLNNLGPEKLEVGWPWRLLMFSAILFGVLVAVYLGFLFGYNPYLDAQIDDVDQEIAALAQSVPVAEQEALLTFYAQLSNLQGVLAKHVVVSKVFDIIERTTNRLVYYSNFDLNVSKRTITIDGTAQSYNVVSQQLESFKQDPDVESFSINQANDRDSEANFKVVLVIKPEVFK
ncbi:MAG: hypothetical protein Q8O87_00230 [bacterium]|nr:hypothetical protein [bacterium]